MSYKIKDLTGNAFYALTYESSIKFKEVKNRNILYYMNINFLKWLILVNLILMYDDIEQISLDFLGSVKFKNNPASWAFFTIFK